MKHEVYVAAHKAAENIRAGSFIPIHAGRRGALPTFAVVGDDTGDNISAKNDTFSELTAMYWIWKNTSGQEYVGLFHYRRHLDLSLVQRDQDKWGTLPSEYADEAYFRRHNLTDAGLDAAIADNDLLLPSAWDVKQAGSDSLLDHFAKAPNQFLEDYLEALRIVEELSPEYAPYITRVNERSFGYLTNMFIARRGFFDAYCAWLFPILFELERRIDISSYSVQERRVFGFVSEWLFNIFIEKYRADHPALRVIELPRTFIINPDPAPKISPAFASNYAAIVAAFDDSFVPYGAAMLRSIMRTSDPDTNYDIVILQTRISKNNQDKLQAMVGSYPNFSLRFVQPGRFFAPGELRTHAHFSVETYYRLAIPQIFAGYEKVIYLDADTIVCSDIAALAHIDMGDKQIAAVRDTIMTGFRKQKVRSLRETGGLPAELYLKNYLGLQYPENYFQAGILVFNLPAIADDFTDRVGAHLSSNRPLWFLDQDLLNVLFEGNVCFLDSRWNVFHGNGNVETFYERLPAKDRNDYHAARRAPYVVHYAGEKKPWLVPAIDFAELFWSALRQTPFYEEALLSLLQKGVPSATLPKTQRRVAKRAHANKAKEPTARDVYRAFASPFAPLGSRRRVLLRWLARPLLRRKS